MSNFITELTVVASASPSIGARIMAVIDSDETDRTIDRVMMVAVPSVCALSVGYGCGIGYGIALIGVTAAAIGAMHAPISTRKVGGLRFVKIWRLTFSYSIAKAYRPL